MSVAETIRRMREAPSEGGGSVSETLSAMRSAAPASVSPEASFPTRSAYYDAAEHGQIRPNEVVQVGGVVDRATPRQPRTDAEFAAAGFTPEETARIRAQMPKVGLTPIPEAQVKQPSVKDTLAVLRSGTSGGETAPVPEAAGSAEAPPTLMQDIKGALSDASGAARDALRASGLPGMAAKAVDSIAALSPFQKPHLPGSVGETLQMLRAGQAKIPAGPLAVTEPTALIQKAGQTVKSAVAGALATEEHPQAGIFSKVLGKTLLAPAELALGLPPGMFGKIEDAAGKTAISPKAQDVVRQAVLAQPFTPSEFQEAIGTEAIFGVGVPAVVAGVVNRFPGMALRFGLTDAASVFRSAMDEVGGEIWSMPDGKSRFIRSVEGINPSAGRKLSALAENLSEGELKGVVNKVMSGRVKFFVKAGEGVGPEVQLTGPAARAPVNVPPAAQTPVAAPEEGLPEPSQAASESNRFKSGDYNIDTVRRDLVAEKVTQGVALDKEDHAFLLLEKAKTGTPLAEKEVEFLKKLGYNRIYEKLQSQGVVPAGKPPADVRGLDVLAGEVPDFGAGHELGGGAALRGTPPAGGGGAVAVGGEGNAPSSPAGVMEPPVVAQGPVGVAPVEGLSGPGGGAAPGVEVVTTPGQGAEGALGPAGGGGGGPGKAAVPSGAGPGPLSGAPVAEPAGPHGGLPVGGDLAGQGGGAGVPAQGPSVGDTLAALRGQPSESQVKAAVEAAGAQYVGLQTTRQPGKETMALFNDPRTGSTLAVPLSQATREGVAARLAKEAPPPQRFRLQSTGPRTYTVVEELPREPSDLPNEKFLRIKDEKTGEVQTVEAGDLLPVKAKPKGIGKEIAPPHGALPAALEERAMTGQAGLLDKEPAFPGGTPPVTAAAKATEGLPPALEMPEIVELAHELMQGKYPVVFEKMRDPGTRGYFSTRDGKIVLNSAIFKDAAGAAKTLAHEIGHMIDWLPDQNIGRGNILGRIGSLRSYMKDMIEAMPDQAGKVLTPAERESIRAQLVTDLVRKSGGTMQQFIKDPAFRKQIASQIPELYKRRLEAEAMKRGLITQAQVMAELKRITNVWKPFDPAADASYTAYRYSSPELYADAVSVLFNNPALLRQEAPAFYKAWFDYIERKPDVRNTYTGIIDRIKGGAVVEARQGRVEEMFAAGERQGAAERIATQEKPRDIISGIRQMLVDKNEGILAYLRQMKKKGLTPKAEDNPQYWLEEMNYSASEVKAWMEGYTQIYKDLEAAGLHWDDLGEVLFHQRVIGERGGLANPLGFTPSTSAAHLEFMRKQMGDAKWGVLMGQVDKFRTGWQFVVNKLEESGMLSPALMAKVRDNPYYATFDVFTKHADELSGGGSGAGAKIYGQVGTLQEITNPATATLMKGVSLIKAINRNMAAKVTAEFLEKNFGPEVIQPAQEKWNGFTRAPQEPAAKGKGLLTYMKDGQQKGFVVDEGVAKAFQRNPDSFNPIINGIRVAEGFFRQIFVQKNPGFMLFNFIRDLKRAYKNLPGASMADVAKYYIRNLSPAFRRAFDIPDNLVKDMLEKKMLITMEEKWSISTEDEQVRALMDRYFGGKGEDGNPVVKTIKKVGKLLDDVGSAIEAMPKLAGYQYLKDHQKELGLDDMTIAHMIRGQIGSPDFLRRGGSYGLYNNIFMFSNSIKEGWRSDWEVMRDRPAEYWTKTAKVNFLPKILMFAAAIGAMGKGLKDIFDRVSEYDKTNYLVIPLGMTENGKAVYMRLPQDEAGRFASGLLWKMLTLNKGQSMANLADYMAGQAPTLAPPISLAMDVLTYATGKNPYDYFRGRTAIPDQVFEAGGARSHLAFLKYLANQGGASLIYRFPTDDVEKASTLTEKVLGAPIISNILGRFIKISNYGLHEQIQAVANKARQEVANKALDERDAIVASVNSAAKPGPVEAAQLYAEMIKAGALRREGGTSVVPFAQFKENYERFASRRTADPYINALVFARSNEERSALLKYYRESLSPDEYNKVVAQAMAGGHLTGKPLMLSYIEEKKK